ncbi:MAG: hypothetical protein JTJ20_07320 [Blautia sp.]|nr:hypothetical protein [uncultured Blautia sp.]MBN2947056.1 hypothetical protein [Blautia sp.]
MTKKKKSRIRIIAGLVLCVLLLAGTAGLAVADKKINDDLKNASSIENNPELIEAKKTYNDLKTEVDDLKKKVKPTEEKE